VSNPAGGGIAHDYRQTVLEAFPVVVDDPTGLTWEQSGSGRIVDGGRDGAEAYARALNERRAGGYTNWRLPTLDEALSLMTPERNAEFHLDPVFAASAAPFIWTADSWAPAPGEAAGRAARGWVIYYLDGLIAPETVAFNAYVRAVRSN
jgi:hypothetical protein